MHGGKTGREQHIGDHHRVVAGGHEGGKQKRQPKPGTEAPAQGGLQGGNRTAAGCPAQRPFGHQCRRGQQQHEHRVDQQKRAATVLAHHVGKAPHIAQANGQSGHGQQGGKG